MLELGSYLVLNPTPGKDYRSSSEVRVGWEQGDSFVVSGASRTGMCISKQEFKYVKHNYTAVEFHFDKMFKVAVFKPEDL